ncbi:aldo/keto reductase [Pelagicoccus mobilis]|uniref:Aldo/keto reductase n=1 Tax=Pelagicoccus mobilis TaxID=415221 RepID=A0A934VSP3_9BACT|nr:aldo/keto reductase [Pelagicoccus mobilis]MBK1880627.1 aldo/keto reductase [Pelagicoccus mobilis]
MNNDASPNTSRRAFLKSTGAKSVSLALAAGGLPLANAVSKEDAKPANAPTPIWRNRHPDMSYRMLGRTGFMVSELVIGSFAYKSPEHFPIIDDEIDRGINYLDTASAYGQGAVESNIGDYLTQSGNREKIFLATKLSGYYGYASWAIKEIQKDLSESQIEQIRKKGEEMMIERSVLKPGYHMNYFGGQEAQIPKAYFRYLMLKEYGHKVAWQKRAKEHARKLLEEGLARLQTDYIDVLHCPHGLAMPDLIEDETLAEIFAEFKQKGLIRASAVSFHNDVGANLAKAIEVGYYDAAMFAYNIANHAALEPTIYKAKQAGMGLIAMKVARLFAMNDQPEWRREKLNTTLPQEPELSTFAKAYLWALQNPNLSACVSQMESHDEVAENASIVGKKFDLQPA